MNIFKYFCNKVLSKKNRKKNRYLYQKFAKAVKILCQ